MTELEREKGWQLILDEFYESDLIGDDKAIDFIIWIQDDYNLPKRVNK